MISNQLLQLRRRFQDRCQEHSRRTKQGGMSSRRSITKTYRLAQRIAEMARTKSLVTIAYDHPELLISSR